MRYPKERATQTKLKIVRGAYWRFATKGFEATSIEEIMSDCGMTRGSFYAHFRNKRDLYREAMSYGSTQRERRAADAPDSAEQWIESMLRKYLSDSVEYRRTAPPLQLLTDTEAELDPQGRGAPTAVFRSMTKGILASAAERSLCSEEATLSAAAMLVGTLAIARTTDDAVLKEKLIAACRTKVSMLLEREAEGSPNFFWAPLQPSERM